MDKIAYRKGQKITDIKTKKEQKKKLEEIRKSRLAYAGGKTGNYTITVGAAKKKKPKAKKKGSKKKKSRSKKK
ncbi:hypothetical protein GF327_09745 [Candidatus Woesearchaeota archaeon]|nr:hypothetical protein [Candidatus Woesearchaeota archaeon]